VDGSARSGISLRCPGGDDLSVPRRPRLDHAGALHHVTLHAVADLAPFADPVACGLYLRTLDETIRKGGLIVHSYCLMPNHLHLLVETDDGTLSRRLQRLTGTYAQRFRALTGRRGHLFRARFHSELIERDEHLLEVIRYLPLNPVRAGICRHPSLWRWSSHRAYSGTARAPRYLTTSRILPLFGDDPARANKAYVRFVLEGLRRPECAQAAFERGSLPRS
jgi:putative transposase